MTQSARPSCEKLVEVCRDAVAKANARWAEATGEADPPLCASEWQVITHLGKWAFDKGLHHLPLCGGDSARMLAALGAEAKRAAWAEVVRYLEVTLPAERHPVGRGVIPKNGAELAAWILRCRSAAGGRLIELMDAWADRRRFCAPMKKWSAADVAEAYAEARRLLDMTDGCRVEVGRGGQIRCTPLEAEG